MIGMYLIIGVAVLAGGIAIGIFTMVSIGTRREERIFREERIISPQGRQQPGQGRERGAGFLRALRPHPAGGPPGRPPT